MAKPIGAACNLRCAYCYYLEKEALFNQHKGIMSNDVLENYIRETLFMHGKAAAVEFAWHGGEPTLAPISFYQQAITLQKKYGNGREIVNTLQTNGTRLTDDWCDFFARNNFLIGLSIDGDERFNDIYRRDFKGGTFRKIMKGVGLLKKHGVPFNTLTTVNAGNVQYPREVYLFLREISDYMQFLPVVECVPAAYEKAAGQHFATPSGIRSAQMKHPLSKISVNAIEYGRFLCEIFDLWKGMDKGRRYVQIIEATLSNLNQQPAGVCVHEALCGHAAVLEMNGDLFSCDRYAYDDYKIGNILETPLEQLMEKNRQFGMHKTMGLPDECLDCRHIRLCFGGCPKDRFDLSQAGSPGKNYLCEGYQLFFDHLIRFRGKVL